MDLKHAAYIIFKHKYKIIVFLLSSLLVVFFALRLKPPLYEASAQVLVKLGREISVPSQDVMGGQSYVLQKRQEDIYAEVEILESAYLIEEVVRHIGHDKILSSSQSAETEPRSAESSFFMSSIRSLAKNILTPKDEKELTPFEKTVMSVRKKLKIEPFLRSETIKIKYSNPGADMAEELLDTFLNKYFERHIEVHKGSGMQDLFQPQADSYKNDLENIEKRLKILKKEESIFSLDTQRKELIEKMADIQKELNETQRDILKKSDKIRRIHEQISSQSQILELPESEDKNPLIHDLKDKLINLELKKQQLLNNYSPESRTVSNINSEIEIVTDQLTSEQYRIMYTNQKDLDVLKLRAQTQSGEISKYVSELKKMSEVEVKKKRLELESQIMKQNYLRYTKELEDARISEVMDLAKITNVRVIQPVHVSVQPKGFRNLLILMLTAFISLFAGVVTVFLLDYLDHSLGTARHVEYYLKLPVLGSIKEKK